MHQSVYDFVARVKAKFPDHFERRIVHEVGSRNINGTVRPFFSNCKYTGFDLGYGPCVDVVGHYCEMHFPLVGGPKTIISCEALEHDKRWRETVHHMIDQVRTHGLIIITAGGPGRPEHGTKEHDPECSPATLDHYENITEEAFREAVNSHPDFVMEDFKEFAFEVEDGDFRFWGTVG